MEFIRTYFIYLKQRKKFWLVPAVLALLIIGGILISSSGSVFAPFIYTIF